MHTLIACNGLSEVCLLAMVSVRKTAALNEPPGVTLLVLLILVYFTDRDGSNFVTMILQKLHDICVNTHAWYVLVQSADQHAGQREV